MSYEDLSESYVSDILNRLEFVRNTPSLDKPYTKVDFDIDMSNKLVLRSYQRFAQLYCSSNTPARRIFIKYGTGVGKTVLACNICKQMVDIFKKKRELNPKIQLPSILILGPTKGIFRKELLSRPEFGYITTQELDRMRQLEYNAKSGSSIDRDNLREFGIMLRRRLSNKKKSGFFAFYGFREFVNRSLLSDIDISTLNEEEIHDRIKSGDIKINYKLFETFRNSQIVCDEIHNVYNSCDKNNWGIIIQALLDYLGNDVNALFLSATPINHYPSEIIDLLNLVSMEKYAKEDFFKLCDSENCTAISNESVFNKIGKLFAGKILFLADANPKYYPRTFLEGEKIKSIDMLKFVRSEMPPHAYEIYKKIYSGTLSQDSQYIMDFILPDPTSADGWIYKTQEVKDKYHHAKLEWLENNNIIINNVGTDMILTGEFLHMTNLKRVSTKYHTMMQDIIKHIKNGGGKILIYHKYVRMSGVLFIKEVLSQNGIIDIYSDADDSTLDVNTGIPRRDFNTKNGVFMPCKYVLYYGDMDKIVRDCNIDKFNSASNATGSEIKILIGSDSIRESLDLKAVSMLMVMSKPDDISSLIQLFGRANRQKSHSLLPPEKRNVIYRIYTTKLPDGKLSYEEEKYRDRVNDYKIIQKIEKSLNEVGADAAINYNMIKTAFVEEGEIGVLKFTPKYNFTKNPMNWTSNAYFNEIEITDVIYIIKRLFMEVSTTLKMSDILKLVKDPPFTTEFNPTLISDDNIHIAMFRLTINNINISNDNSTIIEKLFDPNEKRIVKDGAMFNIVKIDEYYILVGVSRDKTIYVESQYRDNTKQCEIDINLNEYILHSHTNESYEIKKSKFIRRYEEYKVDDIGILDSVCDYSIDFQRKFIEEIIFTIYTIMTEPKKINIPANILDFYIKMIVVYDIKRIILFYDTTRKHIQELYNFTCDECNSNAPIINIISNIITEHPQGFIHKTPTKVGITSTDKVRIIKDSIKKKLKIGFVLPIGYSTSTIPRFYNSTKGWFDASGYGGNCIVYKENDIVIGFYYKEISGLSTKFKIRAPVQKQYGTKGEVDMRKVERGTNCDTKSKEYLVDILDKLGAGDVSNLNRTELCETLLNRLLYLELMERSNPTSTIKYLYDYWECQPIPDKYN
uniref:Helicase ATP-binding domain-containing protein n=1 Tax=viral metagenome TaxID=1070528 RepID=A0A6C0BCS3_9ZZZZ